MRGDDPTLLKALRSTAGVCPACAGMIRNVYMYALESSSLPRMRGDDPATERERVMVRLFAPHARG